MANNTDNQMTRFLFAILKQKNLKDIDWNAVAHDPVLTQPITNGHAARMRYSRFRSSMLGLEPQRRNRNSNKNKVTKPKKEGRAGKKEEDAAHRSPIKVKQEHSQTTFHPSHFTPTSIGSPAGPECQANPHLRLLTPSSDDMLAAASHPLQFSPPASVLGTFDIPGVGPCGHEQQESHHDAHHDHSSWMGSPVFSAFDAAFNIEGYGIGGMCDHHASANQTDSPNLHPSPSAAAGFSGQINIKTEQWDPQYHG